MSEYRFATCYTKKLEYLISCVQTASYGQSEGSFNPRIEDRIPKAVRQLTVGDRVFLNFGYKLLAGPFIIANPPDHFVIDKSVGSWHKVNPSKTPTQYQAVWMYNEDKKLWCIFFDELLTSQVNYCLYTFLPKNLPQLPFIDIIPSELGEQLWTYLEDHGNSFADFLQRQSRKLGFQQPVYSYPKTHDVSTIRSARIAQTFTGRYKAKTGAIVRSKSEKLIADSLHDHGFRFEYERTLLLNGYVIHPDFFLTDHNLVIEHLGLIHQSDEYRANWEWRRKLYDQNNINYITLTEKDVSELDKNLLSKLAEKGCKPSTEHQ
jgi:hypothetical protein